MSCPEELGGACYFEPRGTPLTDWMPTADHYPILKTNGGHLTVDNVRLAHRLCNNVAAPWLSSLGSHREVATETAERVSSRSSDECRTRGRGLP